MYLVNHRADFENNIVINPALQKRLTQDDSDHLFRNDNGRFYNVTQQSGVANKAWGLSASIGDFNNDGWPDIYVANDFLEPDFLYINNQDGTFTDKALHYFKHISTNSMGSDFADINNDLLPDLVVLDMMAADRVRSKENMASMSTENFNLMVNNGYHHQYMSNMLQLNTGANTFSEIGQLAGMAKTDWSWAPLIADFNNDGFNDLFVTNGIENDLSNQDFRNQMRQNIMNRKKVSLEEAINMMPSTRLSNYMFLNNTDYTFNDVSKTFGLDAKINSNGAAYADLDNDGDLDLVLNNQSDKASIYRNNTKNNYVSIVLKGTDNNKNGIGTKVELFTKEAQQVKEVYASRGFQSAVSYKIHFGIGKAERIDSLKVIWPNGKMQILKDTDVNQTIEVSYDRSVESKQQSDLKTQPFELISASQLGVIYKHKAVVFNDYSKQLLLPQKQSTIDHAMAVGDVNGDGLDDIFVGNTQGNPPELFVQNSSGKFTKSVQTVFERDKNFNDNNAVFFDVDNDHDLDIYITSGNYSLPENSLHHQDRLYVNDGNGNFSWGSFPKKLSNTKAISASDFDGDGDVDLFVGGRVEPGKYPNASESYLLENINGILTDVTSQKAKALQYVGMVNDAVFSDYDGDGDKDLLLAGEWMPIVIFENEEGVFTKRENLSNEITGWFQTIKAVDFDNDGDDDYLVGNFGQNNKFHPSLEKPLHIYANYFDDNDSYDTALSKESKGELFPTRGKECSSQQTPFLNEKIGTYKDFANANIFEVYGEENIQSALHLQANSFDSYLIRNNEGLFEYIPLPREAQFGPTLSVEVMDIDNDGVKEILGFGGIYDAEVETVRYDALRGYIIAIDQQANMTTVKGLEQLLDSEVKAAKQIIINGEPYLILLNSNEEVSFLKLLI